MTDRAAVRARDLHSQARAGLAPHGLLPLGWLDMADVGEASGRGLLIGNIGSSLWAAFSASSEFADASPDPLDRWTHRVCNGLARELGAAVRYPFTVPTHPFVRYAMVATGMNPSPLGLAIHHEYGLWTAYRALFVWSGAAFALPARPFAFHPCERCADRPCLSACPVGAFDGAGYDVSGCRAHIRSAGAADCGGRGCRARLACPVGRGYAYDRAQQAFHMAAFA